MKDVDITKLEELARGEGAVFAYGTRYDSTFVLNDCDDITFDMLVKLSSAFRTTNINIGCDLGTGSDPCHEKEIRIDLTNFMLKKTPK